VPAQAADCISIDSLRKKRTGFGPHSFDNLIRDYNAGDDVMPGALPLLRQFLKAGVVSFF